MLELLQNREHAYDGSVIKALLYTVSLYPIGTFVYLSNRKIAEVIDTNPDNPKTPIVQLLTEKDADGSFKTIQIGENNINILRILTKQEKEDIIKLVKEKYSAVEEAKQEMAEGQVEELKEDDTAPAQPAKPAQATAAAQQAPSQPAPAAAPAPAPAPAEPASDASAAPDGTEEVDISIFG